MMIIANITKSSYMLILASQECAFNWIFDLKANGNLSSKVDFFLTFNNGITLQNIYDLLSYIY